MQIPTNSIASLFKQMQSAVGATASVGGGALQELLGGAATSTGPTAPVASAAPVSLTATSPASQFSSQLLAALIAAQNGSSTTSTPSASTSSTSPSSLSLSQIESALTGSGSFASTFSAATQSLSALFGAATGASPTDAGGSTNATASAQTTAAQFLDQANTAFRGHHDRFGAGAALRTLSADASSAFSTTASIAAGLLASV